MEEKIPLLKKIKKLLAKAESANELGNEQEAQAFFSKVNSLLLKHNLDKQALNFVDENDQIIDNRILYGRHTKKAYYGNWEINMCGAISRANLCKMLINKRDKELVICGSESNILIVEYMFAQAKTLFVNFGKTEYKKDLQGICETYGVSKEDAIELGYIGSQGKFVMSYLSGAAEGLSIALLKNTDKFQETKTGKELISVKTAEVDRYVKDKFRTSKTSTNSRVSDRSGYNKGFEKGKSTTLNKGVNHSRNTGKLLS